MLAVPERDVLAEVDSDEDTDDDAVEEGTVGDTEGVSEGDGTVADTEAVTDCEADNESNDVTEGVALGETTLADADGDVVVEVLCADASAAQKSASAKERTGAATSGAIFSSLPLGSALASGFGDFCTGGSVMRGV